MSLLIKPGSVVLILPQKAQHVIAHARIERQSESTGMVYLTDEHGSDRVVFPDELRPARGFSGIIPPATPEHLRPKSAPLGFQDFGAKSKQMAAERAERKRKRLANDKKPERVPGLTYAEVAELAGCTLMTVKHAVYQKKLKRVRLSLRRSYVETDDGKRWAAQYRAMKGRA